MDVWIAEEIVTIVTDVGQTSVDGNIVDSFTVAHLGEGVFGQRLRKDRHSRRRRPEHRCVHANQRHQQSHGRHGHRRRPRRLDGESHSLNVPSWYL